MARNQASNKHVILLAGFQLGEVMSLEDILADAYHLAFVESFSEVPLAIETHNAEMLILDSAGGNTAAFALCESLRRQYAREEMPILFLSEHESEADESYALSVGANDFIEKPLSTAVVLARVHTHIQLAAAQKRLRVQNRHLQDVIELRTQEVLAQSERVVAANKQLSQAQAATITAICSLAEVRDSETGNHILRTQHYVKAMATHLLDHPRFKAHLNAAMVDVLYQCTPLHDIGKLVIPDKILLKPSRLNDTEWQVMMRHTEYGHKAIMEAADKLGLQDGPFLRTAADIAYSHHEKWDGTGYPQGLKGEEIPVAARLMAVADVYDALICKRVYKRAYSHAEAFEIMKKGRGLHFDPDIVDALVQLQHKFVEISEKFPD